MSTHTAKPRIAFQGERGAFSEEAAHKLLGTEIELVPRRTFAELHVGVETLSVEWSVQGTHDAALLDGQLRDRLCK